jgi:hypothetical protein
MLFSGLTLQALMGADTLARPGLCDGLRSKMSIDSLQCPLPIRLRKPAPPRDYVLRDRAIALFDQGEALQAVHATLQCLLPSLAGYGESADAIDLTRAPLCFVQGSARVRVQLQTGQLSISTGLLHLTPQAQNVAALRYALTRLGGTGQLFQPRLRGDALSMEFSDQITLMHPHKIMEVLNRLPGEADRADSWMSQHFSTLALDREPVAPLPAEEFARAFAIWQQHWNAVDALQVQSRRRRTVRFLNVLGSYAQTQVLYTLPLFGPVRQQLQESADIFSDHDETSEKRDSALARCIKEMRNISEAQLQSCLGHASFAINPLYDGTPSQLTAVLGSGQSMQTTGEYRASGRSLEAGFELVANYLYLLAYHSWTPEIEASLRAGLDLASDKPWRDVADALWTHANSVSRQHGSHGSGKRDEDEDENKDGYQA